ncbi:N,N'-diacetylchitobiose transport system permease protein [Actinoplanes octamycinicus]|uniref:N,N'-diacetylchitobiose transport system permease protein n=1 Tax=Actinoplanes octamycinicus TaxID=135948 RepID=A0A7W7GXA1_9ACTN|nr:carbohydrate ABC transporter permease [Actinoplanes octamycinicus]MBB4740004.1 N,N'-diacetylchitobiose transport system permease protein [Actinoplanes octamycinicus]GIE55189.1 sugar ABC transporter permease [Actinoplanes octamycinicus]
MAVLTSTPPRRKARKADDGVMTVGRSRAGSLVANISGVIFALVMFFPVYWVLITAFKPQTEWSSFTPTFIPNAPTLDNFTSAFNAPLFKQSLVNGVLVTAMAVVAALIVGFLGALAVARFRFYGRRAIIMVVLAVQLIPFISLLIPIFLMLQSWNAVGNTLVGVTLVYTVLILPYTVWMLRGFIAGIPRELDEAAMIDGCTRGQVFWRIVLPLTGPGLVATSVYGFIQAWNEFMIINTLNDPEHQNLMAWLMQNQTSRGTYWGPLMAGAIITSIPVVIFFLAVQRNIASGLTAGAVKG